MWGSSSSDIYAAGQGLFHFDGTTWSGIARAAGFYDEITTVWGSSANDVFAAGQYGSIEHFDGSKWSLMVSSENTDWATSFSDLWGSSSSDVFVLNGASIAHYNGSSWTETTTGPINDINAVYGTSAANVFAVGQNKIASEGTIAKGFILRYDGNSWSTLYDKAPGVLTGVWSSPYSEVFAVGTNTVIHNPEDVQTNGVLVQYNVNTGSIKTITNSHALNDVWGTSNNDVFVVGSGGFIWHFDGTTWTEMNSGTGNNLLDIWGTSPTDIWAVGAPGVIVHYNGKEWSSMGRFGVTGELQSIWGTSSSNIFAVGYTTFGSGQDTTEVGVILHYDGTSWTSMKSPTWRQLYSVVGKSATDVYAFGQYGTVLHYDGSSWQLASFLTGLGTSMNDGWTDPNGGIVVVGIDGCILRSKNN
jgi:hypothetical protein